MMHTDRLRWLVRERAHLTLDGASEIAKAAPALLKKIEELERDLGRALSQSSYHCD